MAANTEISWCDATFNPWIGCTKVSPGCDNCYAAKSTPARTMGITWGVGQPRQRTKTWGDPVKWNKGHPAFFAQHGRRRRVFCASLADVFDNQVDPNWRADLFELISLTRNIDWLLLTKRIGNAQRMLAELTRHFAVVNDRFQWPLPNVWLGATIVNQEEADRDIPKLLATPAAVRFLSMEPLLGPVNLGAHLWQCCGSPEQEDYGCYGNREVCCGKPDARELLDWVIVGGESGPGARPMQPAWARSLRDQCAAADVPLHFKQWGEWAPYDRGRVSGKELATMGALDDPMQKFGKKLSGRLLDGATHNAFPESV